jgi:ferredoxin
MPTIVFESVDAPAVVVHTKRPERLIDLCDEASAPVPFSCRGVTCGTCAIIVTEGEDLLEPPDIAERMLMEKKAIDGRRFACSVRVKADKGTIRLRVCGSLKT